MGRKVADVTIRDYSGEVRELLKKNKKAALRAVGVESVGLVTDGMYTLYGKPIIDSGNLIGSIDYEVARSGEDTVDVGTDVEYSPFVHDGTRKMAARPFIRDSLLGDYSQSRLGEVYADYLSRGFK